MKEHITGNYMIYKFYNRRNNDMVTEFFLPDESLARYFRRLATIKSYKENGYQIAGILYVSHEAYLNARLTNYVEEYCYLDAEEQETRRQYRRNELSAEVALKTIEMYEDSKWTKLKQISSVVRRLINNDYDGDNEIALQLYDQYSRTML